jgi:hypothetical protein
MSTDPQRAFPGLAALAVSLAACNALFGIGEGVPASGSGGATTTTSTSTTAVVSGTTSSTGSGDAGPVCEGDPVDGELSLWSRSAGGPAVTTADALAITAGGGVIVAGTFSDDATVLGAQALPYPALEGGAEGPDLYVAEYDGTGALSWVQAFNGPGIQMVAGAALDPSQDVLVAGSFGGSVTFGATTIAADESEAAGAVDGFVAKLDPGGAPLWARRFGGPGDDMVMGVAADEEGSVLVAGVTAAPAGAAETADFGCGQVTVPAGQNEIWLSKLGADGSPLWCRVYAVDTGFAGAASPPLGLSVAAAPGGDVVLAGGAYSASSSFGLGALPAFGGADVFVFQADASGEPRWAQTYGDASDQWASHVAVDSCGEIVIGGGFTGTVTLSAFTVSGPDPDGGGAGPHIFLAKLVPGTGPAIPRWLEGFWDAGEQEIRAVAVDPAGDVAIAGDLVDAAGSAGISFGGGVTLAPSGPDGSGAYRSDAFVAKFQPNGEARWSKRFGGPAAEVGAAVALDGAGHTLVSGSFAEAVDFGDGPLVPAGDDMFLVRIGP